VLRRMAATGAIQPFRVCLEISASRWLLVRRDDVVPVPPKRLVGACSRLTRRAGPPGATSVVSVIRNTASGHVPRRVGHDGCPVGSRAIERQYRNRQAS
jgi:hypothetical protein